MAAGADWVVGTLPQARRVTLPGEGHAFDPATLAPLLAEFLGGHAVPSPSERTSR